MATLNDFLVECEIFPYSEENYNLIKEAYELNVADLYLRNQRYMRENAEFLKTQEEGVMMEAADPETNKNVEESVKTKSKNWKEKVKKIWKKVLNAFKTFWKAIAKKWGKIFNKSSELEKSMALVDPNKISIEEVTTLVNKAMDNSNNIINLSKGKVNKLPKIFLKALPDTKKNVKQAIALAVCSDPINCISTSEKYKMALNAQQLKEFFNIISDKNFLSAKEPALLKAVKYLENSTSYNLKHGVQVSGNVEDLNTLIENTNDVLNKVMTSSTIKDDNYVIIDLDEDSYSVGDISSLFADVQNVASDTIKMYTDVINFKETMLNGLRSVVNNAKSSD